MRPIAAFSRSLDRVLVSKAPTQICRSCRLQAAGPQRRQIQTSARLRAATTISDDTKTALNTTSRLAESPEEDPDYVESLQAADLEHVGSPTWVERQYDPQDAYKGWVKVPPHGRAQLKDEEVNEILRRTAQRVLAAKGESMSTGSEWLSHRLTDQNTKFALVKGLRQKTGLSIPDHQWSNAKSLNDIRMIILTKPQPKRLAEHLIQKKLPAELPNVKIYGRRVTPIDKEKSVGRWKIIEQELSERGLPVTGHK